MDEQSFFAEIDAAPNDPAPKLILADWLEERGDTRADFIRDVINKNIRKKRLKKLAGKQKNRFFYIDDILLKENAALFAADCAERVLCIFEKQFPEDKRPRKAIVVARAGVSHGSERVSDAARAAGHEAYPATWVPVTEPSDMVDLIRYAASEAAYAASSAAMGDGSLSVRYALQSLVSSLKWTEGHTNFTFKIRKTKKKERRWQLTRLCEYNLFQRPIYLGDQGCLA